MGERGRGGRRRLRSGLSAREVGRWENDHSAVDWGPHGRATRGSGRWCGRLISALRSRCSQASFRRVWRGQRLERRKLSWETSGEGGVRYERECFEVLNSGLRGRVGEWMRRGRLMGLRRQLAVLGGGFFSVVVSWGGIVVLYASRVRRECLSRHVKRSQCRRVAGRWQFRIGGASAAKR